MKWWFYLQIRKALEHRRYTKPCIQEAKKSLTNTALATYENPVQRLLVEHILEGWLERLELIVGNVRHDL